MDTNELIKALAADTRPPAASLSSVWWGAAGLAIALAAAVFFAMLGPRPDIAAAAETPRFLFKFVVTITLAVSAFGVARALSRPGEAWRKAVPGARLSATIRAFASALQPRRPSAPLITSSRRTSRTSGSTLRSNADMKRSPQRTVTVADHANLGQVSLPQRLQWTSS